MGQKRITGLTLRDGIWHIDKQVKGVGRICENTGVSDREEAEEYLVIRLEQLRKTKIFGAGIPHLGRSRNLLSKGVQTPTLDLALSDLLNQLAPYIDDLFVHEIDDEALQPYVDDRQEAGRANRTINIALQRVVRNLNLCARKWRDDQKRPWLDSVPMIEMLSEKQSRQPYPLSWDEQALFFKDLPDHLQPMALYKVNTGCREQDVCKLRWEWEIEVPNLAVSVFLLPADFGGRFEDSGVKNGEERLIVLNDVVSSIIRKQRDLDPE